MRESCLVEILLETARPPNSGTTKGTGGTAQRRPQQRNENDQAFLLLRLGEMSNDHTKQNKTTPRQVGRAGLTFVAAARAAVARPSARSSAAAPQRCARCRCASPGGSGCGTPELRRGAHRTARGRARGAWRLRTTRASFSKSAGAAKALPPAPRGLRTPLHPLPNAAPSARSGSEERPMRSSPLYVSRVMTGRRPIMPVTLKFMSTTFPWTRRSHGRPVRLIFSGVFVHYAAGASHTLWVYTSLGPPSRRRCGSWSAVLGRW